MSVEREKITKNIIAETAFREWGKTGFRNMSLTLISEKLCITKAALYRHFKSKESLIEYMTLNIKDTIAAKLKYFIEMAAATDDVIALYIRFMVDYFTESHYRLFFYTIILSKFPFFDSEDMRKLRFEQIKILEKYLTKNNPALLENAENLLYYTSTTVMYYLSFQFYSKMFCCTSGHFIEEYVLSDSEIEEFKEDIINIVNYGFDTMGCSTDIDYNKIENSGEMKKESIPVRAKILDAIAFVVAEDGLWNVTIDKIAKKLGMAKSSLYLYFRNKNEMIVDMIETEFLSVNSLYKLWINESYDFYEKLYAHIYATFNYFKIDLEHMKIVNWMHFQNINLKNGEKIIRERYDFFIKAIEEKKIKQFTKFNYFPIVFLNVHITKDIMIYKSLGKNPDNRNTRFLYKLFLKGVKGGQYVTKK